MAVVFLAGSDVDDAAPVSRIGGKPLLPRNVSWPTCGGCGEPLGFVAQVDVESIGNAALRDSRALLFACDRFGPRCGSAPDGEGTRVLLVAKSGAEPSDEPAASDDARPRTPAFQEGPLALIIATSDDIPAVGSEDDEGRMVVGQAGADFEWAQDPVDLECDCGDAMQPLFQLDEAWGMTTATYTLACPGCKNAKLVVQSY